MMGYGFPFLSICIPSFNRPEEIGRLLSSIDADSFAEEIEVVVCEDCSPKRDLIRETVNNYAAKSAFSVKYVENKENMGYDRNLRECIKQASGKWVMFMGDDDMFVPGKLSGWIEYAKENKEIAYILRSYQSLHEDGSVERFVYFDGNRIFSPGYEAYVTLFRKSVFISGVALLRDLADKLATDRFDGSLLYQLYLEAEICMSYKSAYYSEPFTQSVDGGTPYFGSSKTEKNLYTPGLITVENSIEFMKKFFEITLYMDEKYGFDSTSYVKSDFSKYSYPVMSIQRNKGRKVFREYCKELIQLGINCTFHFKLYYYFLLVFGCKVCDNGIRLIKKVMGRTPQL